ncbi:MAG: hypothetical protein CNLJKLNK_00355 [Holosporales bacterium]
MNYKILNVYALFGVSMLSAAVSYKAAVMNRVAQPQQVLAVQPQQALPARPENILKGAYPKDWNSYKICLILLKGGQGKMLIF